MTGLVKPFLSTQGVLAAMSGQVGALLAILREALVTGAGAKTPVSITVASGIATATYSIPHKFIVGSVLLTAGADQTALNGEARVLSVPSIYVYTFATTAADGTATGTITARLAPAGWEEVYTGTNVAVFKPTAVGVLPLYLRVDDTQAAYARVTVYESMTDVDTGVNRMPTVAQSANGLVWSKSNSASTSARGYSVFADGGGIYFCPDVFSTQNLQIFYAGVFKSFLPGDGWAVLLAGAIAYGDYGPTEGSLGRSPKTLTGGVYVQRPVGGAAGSLSVRARGESANGSSTTYSGNTSYANLSAFPNPANTGLLLSRVEVEEGGGIRGTLPGLYHCRQAIVGVYAGYQIIDVEEDLGSRKLMAVRCGDTYYEADSSKGIVFVDLTDTWSR